MIEGLYFKILELNKNVISMKVEIGNLPDRVKISAAEYQKSVTERQRLKDILFEIKSYIRKNDIE